MKIFSSAVEVMSVSVLLIGAGGTLSQPLLQELIRQRNYFKAIAILASSTGRIEKFSWVREKGVEIVVGLFLEAKSCEGRYNTPRSLVSWFLLNFFSGFTNVISAVGNDLTLSQSEIMDAVVSGGVTHFYSSEWNSDISQKEICGMAYFNNKKITPHIWLQKQRNTPTSNTLFLSLVSLRNRLFLNFMDLLE